MRQEDFPGTDYRGEVRENEPLARRTTWRIGGPARWLARPRDEVDLADLMVGLPDDTPRFILGGGSNLLVEDAGYDGVVIDLAGGFNRIRRTEEELIVYAEAGAETRGLAHFTRKSGLAGLEFLAGIPGSVGGAVKMNAGAYGGEIKDRLSCARVMDPEGGFHRMNVEQLGLGYRTSALPEGWLIVGAAFRLEDGDPESIREEMKAYNRKRRASQPLEYPSAGSVFKNPADGPKAWELIDQAGLRGTAIGAAQVSEKHGNFFVNRGGATSDAMRALIGKAEEEVFKTAGIRLEREIGILGPKGLVP